MRGLEELQLALEQEVEVRKQEAKVERAEIQPTVDELNEKLKRIGKTQEDKERKKFLLQEKAAVTKRLHELEADYRYDLPRRISEVVQRLADSKKEADDLRYKMGLTSTNPIAFCQEVKRKVDSALLDQSI